LENDLKPKSKSIEEELKNLKAKIESDTTLNINFNTLITYQNWNELNWQDEVKKVEELNREKLEIETSNDLLKLLQDNLTKVNEEITQIENDKTEKTKTMGGLEENIRNHKEEITGCKSIRDTVLKEESEIYYPKIDKLIEQTTLTFKNIDNISNTLSTEFAGKNGKKDKLNEKLKDTSNRIIGVMQSYAKDFPSESMELSVEIDALQEFIWPDLIKVCRYFKSTPKPNLYIHELRIQVSTKFIEEHKGIIKELLDILIKEHVQQNEKIFEKYFNLKYAVRFRILDKQISQNYFSGTNDLSIPISQFEQLELPGKKCISCRKQNKSAYR
jgi:hypothetical protein